MAAAVPRFQELIAPAHWRTVDFLSDLHLQASEPATAAAWQRYLKTTPADALCILGDLFEVWVGDDALDEPGSFEAQACGWLRTAAQRCAVYFLHGNRDFLVGAGFAAHTGATLLTDPTVLAFQGQRWLLSHGDALCLDDVDYQRFRAQVRTSAWQAAFLAQSLLERRTLARGLRSESEARKRSSQPYADVDAHAALAWLRAAQAHTLIHGHTHQPATHQLDTGGAQRVVLSDWDLAAPTPRGDVLRLTPQGLERIAIVPT